MRRGRCGYLVPRINVDAIAFTDPRFGRLAQLMGYADADHARSKVEHLWLACTVRGETSLPQWLVEQLLGPAAPAALVESELARWSRGRGDTKARPLYIRGAEKRTRWYQQNQDQSSKGGKARAANASRSAGKFSQGSAGGDTSALALALAPALSLAQEKEPEPAAPALDAKALTLSGAAVSEINRLRGSHYQPDTESTVKACAALVRKGVTPDQVVAVIRYIACPRKGSEGWLASETFRERVCPETLLQTKRVMQTLATIEATAAPALRFEPRPDDDYSRIPGMEPRNAS